MTRPPDVAVEVLSQSRLILRLKVGRYVHFGIKSVWVVDTEWESIDVYQNGARRTLTGDDRLETQYAPGFSATVAALLGP